jgi:hypothetical protein
MPSRFCCPYLLLLVKRIAVFGLEEGLFVRKFLAVLRDTAPARLSILQFDK